MTYQEILSDHKWHNIQADAGIIYVDGVETDLDSMPQPSEKLLEQNGWFKLEP